MTAYHAYFSALQDPTFTDWGSTDSEGVAFDSFFNSCQSLDNPDYKTQVPYVYSFLEEGTADDTGAFLKVIWDWQDPTDTLRVTPEDQVYKYHNGYLVGVRKTRVRGRGRSVHVYYSNDGTKDFNIKGWVIFYSQNEGQ